MTDRPFVATDTIFINGARAFNAGDVVPEQHVKDYGLEAVTAREGSKAATAATTTATTTKES